MAAYFVLTQTITDMEKYQKDYVPGVLPFLAKHKGEVVVADVAATPVQGEPAAGVVVVKFPSVQAAQDFVNDPDYQPVLGLRLSITTNAAAVIAPAFTPPS